MLPHLHCSFTISSAIGFAFLFAEAERERQVAEETLRGFQDSIGLINPETGQGTHDMSVSEYITLMQDHVENDLTDKPRIASALLTTLGLIELAFDDFDRALFLLTQALILREDGSPAARGEAHHNLGRVAVDRGDYQTALIHYEQARKLRLEAYGPAHEDVAMTLQHLGSTRRRIGDFSESIHYYDQAEVIWVELFGARSEQLAGLRNNRAWVDIGQARLAEKAGNEVAANQFYEMALSKLREASAMVRGIIPANDYRIGRAERSIAQVLASLGRHQEALPRYDEAERILVSRRGPDSQDVITVIRMRSASRLQLGVQLDDTAEELARVAEVREAKGREFSAVESWERAERLWGLLEQVQKSRGDESGVQYAAERRERALGAIEELTNPPRG